MSPFLNLEPEFRYSLIDQKIYFGIIKIPIRNNT